MGRVMANYAAGSDESDPGSRSRSSEACIRCDDADEKDRHRCHRSGTPRLTFGALVRRAVGAHAMFVRSFACLACWCSLVVAASAEDSPEVIAARKARLKAMQQIAERFKVEAGEG